MKAFVSARKQLKIEVERKVIIEKLLKILKKLWLNLPVKLPVKEFIFNWFTDCLWIFSNWMFFSFVGFITNRDFLLTCSENIVYDEVL